MRIRYQRLIGYDFLPENVYICSSDVNRTVTSALSNAAGMFPPSGDQKWKNFNWKPTLVHITASLDKDYLVYQAIPCPRIEKLQQKYYESPEVSTLLRQHSKLLEYLENNSGMKVRSLQEAGMFYDPFKVEEDAGLT